MVHLIKLGDDIDQVYKGQSPLQFATREGNISAIRLLLEHGADALLPRPAGYEAPLNIACSTRQNNYSICKLLLDMDHDCNYRGSHGATPFHTALRNQRLEVVKLLLRSGADIEMVDRQGNTALHFAASNPQLNVIAFVLDLGFDI